MAILNKILAVGLAMACALGSSALAQTTVDLEAGLLHDSTNDVRVPGKGGTLASLLDGLETRGDSFVRLRVSHVFGERHTVSALIAPLAIQSAGFFRQLVLFEGMPFAPGNAVIADYRSDAFQLTYRYAFLQKKRFELGLGLTAKLRSSAIRLESVSSFVEKTNSGFEPLLNFRLLYQVAPWWDLLGEGDVLATSSHRTADLFFGVRYAIRKVFAVKVGYRLLQNRTDTDEIYSDALFHCASAGAVIRF